jgi:hypothetical protein
MSKVAGASDSHRQFRPGSPDEIVFAGCPSSHGSR